MQDLALGWFQVADSVTVRIQSGLKLDNAGFGPIWCYPLSDRFLSLGLEKIATSENGVYYRGVRAYIHVR